MVIKMLREAMRAKFYHSFKILSQTIISGCAAFPVLNYVHTVHPQLFVTLVNLFTFKNAESLIVGHTWINL